MNSLHLIAALGIALLNISVAQATDTRLDWAHPYAGAWTLSGTSEGDAYCELVLGDTGVIGGAALTISVTCQKNFPLIDVTGWTIRNQQLVLIDALRNAVMAFERLPDGSYASPQPNGVMLALDKGPPPNPETRAELFDGTFSLSGANNQDACGFFVTAMSNNNGALEQNGTCPPLWKNQSWHAWRFADGKLHLLDKVGATILSLTPADSRTFTTETPEGTLYFGPGVIVIE